MEYKRPPPTLKPRLIIHGGAGNLTPTTLPPERHHEFRTALLTIIAQSHHFMTTPTQTGNPPSPTGNPHSSSLLLPTALAVATHAVTLLENNPLFNAGHGAVFTRDGTNELEASVMVSRGHAKRGVGVSGLRRVRNPILLAQEVLLRGEGDLSPSPTKKGLDVPSAQGHGHVHGLAAEQLAQGYGLGMVEEGYFWTRRRWEEHVRGLEREKAGKGGAMWCRDEYLPQGTVGAVALDGEGVVCVATSTGGLTNKLSGRVGDTPTVGAGFWAEEWVERGDPSSAPQWRTPGPAVMLSDSLKGLVAECFPTPWMYAPVLAHRNQNFVTTRSVAVSGTGNGDSFLRTGAARTVGSIARFAGDSSAVAVTKITGPGGELQESAGDRWGKTGEGEGGMIGIECVVVRDAEGNTVETRSELLQDYNCGGMFRAWVDDRGVAFARVFREDQELPASYLGEGRPENTQVWRNEKLG
ncbi:nucleophile aminohydrolase [Chaetomidium leptoderma]|uniref:Nucleophile aminohydrolase n=1 Tax=Chaetomidium leptoderma TaxID=669021 RepID=A0AAN6VRQ6_9PEZI|nr:nucleophile aminohydrolase [Chaetomidium leptoderma]